jgi:N4-gp56 family major capsid protein
MPLQVFGTSSLGGYTATASIDSELRQRATKTTYHHQMALGLPSYGRHRSDRILFDKMGRVVTPLNQTGIGELDDIPVTSFPFVQGQVIATEYANAVEWTEKLEIFSQFPIGNSVALVLRQDQLEGLDKVAYAAYNLGRVFYTPTSATTGTISTSGTPATTAGSPMTTSHVKDVTDYMRTNAVPPISPGKYFCIAHPDHMRGIKDSSDFINYSVFSAPQKLVDSEVGEYAGVKFVEENNALSSPAGTNTAGLAEAFYFGADNVVEGVAVAPHIRYKIPQGYGRDRGESSYAVLGFSPVWAFNTDSEEHQVHVSST